MKHGDIEVEAPVETTTRIMRELSETIGVRFSASDGEHRAALLLRDEFAAQGVEVELQRLGFVGWEVTKAPTVEVLTPEPRALACAPVVYSAPADVEGRLVRHGTKTLIAGLYEQPTHAVLDADGQPLAHLVASSAGDAIPLINPRPLYRLPQVVIGEDDHRQLGERLDAGEELRVRVTIGTRLDPDAYSYNVVATYQGNPSTTEHIVVCAHYDTQLDTPGCYDNASGTAGMFSILEGLRERQLPVNVTFVAIAGEEVGMHGSHYYVNDLVERGVLADVRYCVCLDQISGGDFFWLWCTDPTLRAQALEAIDAAGVRQLAEVRVDDNKPGADHWAFHERGVPACLLMWWRQADYHRPTDTFDKADLGKVRVAVDAALGLVERLARDW